MVLIFGVAQIFLSQLPNLESIWLVSALGATCSIGYSIIALALGARSIAHGQQIDRGSLWGRPAPPFEKAMGVFGALGDISVSYYCAIVILEIQVRGRRFGLCVLPLVGGDVSRGDLKNMSMQRPSSDDELQSRSS